VKKRLLKLGLVTAVAIAMCIPLFGFSAVPAPVQASAKVSNIQSSAGAVFSDTIDKVDNFNYGEWIEEGWVLNGIERVANNDSNHPNTVTGGLSNRRGFKLYLYDEHGKNETQIIFARRNLNSAEAWSLLIWLGECDTTIVLYDNYGFRNDDNMPYRFENRLRITKESSMWVGGVDEPGESNINGYFAGNMANEKANFWIDKDFVEPVIEVCEYCGETDCEGECSIIRDLECPDCGKLFCEGDCKDISGGEVCADCDETDCECEDTNGDNEVCPDCKETDCECEDGDEKYEVPLWLLVTSIAGGIIIFFFILGLLGKIFKFIFGGRKYGRGRR
jgi:hypothetical protein